MKEARLAPLLILTIVSIAALAPASALAEEIVERKGFRAEMTFEGSRGYQISVEARGNGRVKLTASDFDFPQGAIAAEYTTRGQVSAERIEARFGRLGHVSVVFEARSETAGTPSPCKGRKPIARTGVWRGRVTFHGERGYTDAVVSQATGTTERSFRRVCGSPRGGSKDGARRSAEEGTMVLLRASRRTDGRRLRFVAIGGRNPLQGVSVISAEAQEQLKGLAVRRVAFAFGDNGDAFTISAVEEAPRWARVAPPRPFRGKAEFREDPGEAIWSGSLRAPLPGLGTLSLTDRAFSPSLCEAVEDEFLEKCANL